MRQGFHSSAAPEYTPNYKLHRMYGWRYGSLERHFPRKVIEPLLTDLPLDVREIPLPAGVSVTQEGSLLKLTSALGSNVLNLRAMDEHGVAGVRVDADKIQMCSRMEGFLNQLEEKVGQVVKGLAQGYLAYLRLNGVGYKATKEQRPMKRDPQRLQDVLILRLGKSHDDIYECTNVKVFIVEPTLICIYGIDRDDVMQAVEAIRAFRKKTRLGERIYLVP